MIENLKFAYETKIVLDIKKLEFEKNKIYAILGANGSGKTTLLKILNGLLGTRKFKIENSIYVHQNPLLFSGTVFDNVAFGLKIRKEKNINEKVKDALKLVGLENFENRKSKNISGGEIQRVAIARALILQPKVLLLDEPTANVDKQTVRLLEKILQQIKNKTTVIFASHDHHFAKRISDKIIYLENGEIENLGE
ncbi:MAG: ATP-binding cassette domain-containing protein [Candidatus Cloacimonetes bacterium]|jgi:tungstate transport system ATP-binding protein|nr:ATP-binding cassette domain-containing protein [Candidatus Cloacimonadota bacterium]MBT7469420.1 ATP-binding cassette domain-containing protein [Candidatus Cloacimonadota bacterium]